MSNVTDTRTVVSIGYEQRDIDEVVDLLASQQVDVLVDVRLNAISRKPGFSKSALSAALVEAGIEYRHERGLGNPKSNREGFRGGEPAAHQIYVSHLRDAGVTGLQELQELSEASTIALMCYERDHHSCHRSAIVEMAWADDPAVALVKV